MTAADLVVSAAGTSSWELLCLGAACAFVCVADNQETSYERVVAAGAVAGVGRLGELRADPSGGIEVLAALLGDEAERVSLRAAGQLAWSTVVVASAWPMPWPRMCSRNSHLRG